MIREFQGAYKWLSNFVPVKIILGGLEYPSVEHAYMSAKSDDKNWKLFCQNGNNTPGKIKRTSRNIKLVSGWDTLKLLIMQECVKQKFNQEPFKTLLIATGTKHIQEGNYWKDEFWGVSLQSGKGRNELGQLIMAKRNALDLESCNKPDTL